MDLAATANETATTTPKLWQRSIPYQREASNKNGFIDKDFINRLKSLPNTLPDGLEWLDFRTDLCLVIATFYHTNFLHGTGSNLRKWNAFFELILSYFTNPSFTNIFYEPLLCVALLS